MQGRRLQCRPQYKIASGAARAASVDVFENCEAAFFLGHHWEMEATLRAWLRQNLLLLGELERLVDELVTHWAQA
jgi:hypothetical protein